MFKLPLCIATRTSGYLDTKSLGTVLSGNRIRKSCCIGSPGIGTPIEWERGIRTGNRFYRRVRDKVPRTGRWRRWIRNNGWSYYAGPRSPSNISRRKGEIIDRKCSDTPDDMIYCNTLHSYWNREAFRNCCPSDCHRKLSK